jgi:hypothetical protein
MFTEFCWAVVVVHNSVARMAERIRMVGSERGLRYGG